jgi:hypothetical protein
MDQALGTGLERLSAHVARIHLIELEYQIAMHKAEVEWVRRRIRELRSGRFAWDLKKILKETRGDRRRAATRKER